MLWHSKTVWVIPAVLAVIDANVVFGQATSTGSGQGYPNKPIRIVTSSAGGTSDFTRVWSHKEYQVPWVNKS